ncbi:Plasmodium variant antigen protein Cir/Yir/Bir, putative [Plasmodium chabaudi chabaudi]|uniref:Plasmodium variant antigen protein Cir/Yir/Bir, putative n=1 Tax=Plasmodium chabaudi chabaudi TaxID=31271 RepID=A0A1C6WVZ6_PLACU|nr:Plasmodium variant antigen protein Cir/Yir/Bir, putative [Plasmodium chabaudi chabaudi]
MDTLCKAISVYDKKITLKWNNSSLVINLNDTKNQYCTDEGGKGECFPYGAVISIFFIKMLENINGNDLNKKKFGEYVILWLFYKLNQKKENEISNLSDFHKKYIKENENHIDKINGDGSYNSYLDIINKKQYLMSMDIKEMSRLYDALEALCKLYTECDEKKKSYTNCSKDAQDFANNFENLNQDSSIIGNNSYREILSNLFNDYDDFKNSCAKKCIQCTDLPTLSEIKTPSSSSVASKIIPVLLTFSIPFFLGVAYKYSLFGFDKRLQRIYPREKLKKIKKKMNRYI